MKKGPGYGTGKPRVPLTEVLKMRIAYEEGASLNEVGRLFGRSRCSVREQFVRRGWDVRVVCKQPPKLPNGQIIPMVPKTAKEIEELVKEATAIRIPDALRLEWRKWTMDKRWDFIQRLRAKLKPPGLRPELPFSANVRPFDYSTPEAWDIVRKLNEGRGSREAAIKVNINSQGVIYKGELWFWCPKAGYQKGQWNPETGRPMLHYHLWREKHGRGVPEGYVIRFADRNPNNLLVSNMHLASRNQLCRENQAKALAQRSRKHLGAVLRKIDKTKGEKHDQ